jgi:hypothetical protein
MIASRISADEYKQGFAVCICGKYAHVFRASVLCRLPHGYNGELCAECSMWMCSVEKLREAGLILRTTQEEAPQPRPDGDTPEFPVV